MIKNGSSHQWHNFPTFENLNQSESAIRQFCPARVEQRRVEEEMLLDDYTLMWPHDLAGEIPQLPPDEVEEIVDTFFDVECYEKDNAYKSAENDQIDLYDHFRENIPQEFSLNDDIHCGSDDLIMVEGDELDPYSWFDDLSLTVPDTNDVITGGVDQGLHLVHLLLACAEAVGCRDTALAESLLSQIWACVTPWGDSLQRVSYCFAMGLKSRLSLLQNVSPNGSFSNKGNNGVHVPLITREEKSEAFQLLHRTTPYVAFGFMSANEAICQASKGKEFLHIVDLGMEHTHQWASLVRSLASKTELRHPNVIRITGIIGDQDPLGFESSVKGLISEAKSLKISLTFRFVTEHVSPSSLTREKLDLRDNESLFVNSVFHLHKHVKESRGSLKIVLQSIKKLNPILLTVVEQDANHNGPFFLGRFLESLHYYSAIFDSLEAGLPRNSIERMKIEKFHFAEEIKNVVAFEGCERIERHERGDRWRRQLGRAGFHVVGLKCLDRARSMLSEYYGCDEYTVALEKNCLQLGWKGRPVVFASAWQVNH